MIWPFENDTSAIVKKMAKRNIGADRKSYWLLILTISLSICMVLSLALVSSGIAEKRKDSYRDNAQVTVMGITNEQLAQMEQNSEISWVSEYSVLGFSYQDGKKIFVLYADDDYFNRERETPYTGNLPSTGNEIMLEQNYISAFMPDCKIGDTVSLDLTGMGKSGEYKISGILSNSEIDSPDDYYLFLNKTLAQSLADETLGGILPITAYPRLKTDAIASDDILSAAHNILEPLGVEEKQIFLTDYSAVMSGVDGTGLDISIPLVALITSVLAMLVIYSVFYTMMTRNVQMLGQLRTIGMTTRQLKKMAKINSHQFSIKGILLGLFGGTIIGFIICPSGFRLKAAFVYWIVAAVFSWLAITIAVYRPVKIASATSPIEGTHYLSYTGKRKLSRRLHRKLTSQGLAIINIQRNKKKAAFTLLTLSLSGILFCSSVIVAESIDAEKQARFRYFPDGEIQLELQNIARSTFDANGEYNYSTKMQFESNPFEDETFMKQFSQIDGVQALIKHNAIIAKIIFPGNEGTLSISGYVPTITTEDFKFIESTLSMGSSSYDEMVKKSGILVAKGYAEPGDLLSLEYRSIDSTPQTIEVPVLDVFDITDLMSVYPVVPGSPYFLMAWDTAKELTGVTEQAGILSIKVLPEKYDDVLVRVNDIAESNDQVDSYNISGYTQSIQYAYNSYINNFYLISIILFLFGGISLTNTLIVDFRNRKHELGLLKAVGATNQMLRKMLNKEVLTYLVSSFLIAIMGSTIASVVICSHLDAVNHCISFAIPWLSILAFVILLTIIYFIFSVYSTSVLKRAEILPTISAQ